MQIFEKNLNSSVISQGDKNEFLYNDDSQYQFDLKPK